MAVDWFRVRPKDSTDPNELRTLIERQATAFQSITSYWIDYQPGLPREEFEQEKEEWFDEYRVSSQLLFDLLEPPPYDEDLCKCTDIPDLGPCQRLFPIIENPIFPPQWRKEASSSILVEELREWLKRWRSWIEEVSQGKHRGYLLQLWAHKESLSLFDNWQTLQKVAKQTIGRTNNWAHKPKFIEAREKVLATPAPVIHLAPTSPRFEYECSDALRTEIEQTAVDLISVTRQWDCCVKDSFKLRLYRNYYFSFEQFIERGTSDDYYPSNLEWVERCCSLGFGMYLDY